jgi:hypothetical protein
MDALKFYLPYSVVRGELLIINLGTLCLSNLTVLIGDDNEKEQYVPKC